MVFIQPTKELAARSEVLGAEARQLLAGKLYSKDFLDEVEGALGSFRQVHASAQ